jgi:hypothetical protein
MTRICRHLCDISYNCLVCRWKENLGWVKFRTTPHQGHVPSNINTLVRQCFLDGSGGKRNRQETTEQDVGNEVDTMATQENDDAGNEEETMAAQENEQTIQMNQTTYETPVKRKRAPDNRKWCFRCTYKVRMEHKGLKNQKPKNLSRINGLKPKKTKSICMRCQVALCDNCFRPWHDEEGLPPTPAALG